MQVHASPARHAPCAEQRHTTCSQALKSGSEEYGRILELLGRYAMFKSGVAFSCKKQVRLLSPIPSTGSSHIS